MIKIAINANSTNPPLTGIGHLTANIAKILQDDPTVKLSLFKNGAWSPRLEETLTAVENSHLKRNFLSNLFYKIKAQSPQAARMIGRLIPFKQALIRKLLDKSFRAGLRSGHADVYVEPNFLPLSYDIPTVIFVHDISYIRHPETQPEDRNRDMRKYLPEALEKAAAIITMSHFTTQELISHFKISDKNIFVACSGADPAFKPRGVAEVAGTLDKFQLKFRKFILAVGTLEPRKNLRRAIAAYQTLPQHLREQFPLVVCGAKGWVNSGIDAAANQLIADGQLRILNYVKQSELNELFSAARCSCYVSIYEGFGTPILESMQSGTPVITSNISSMPEVAGKAGMKVDPYNIEDIKNAMQHLLENEDAWNKQIELGLEEAKRYNWNKCVEVVKEACHFAAGK